MADFTRSELKTLVGKQTAPCISLYMAVEPPPSSHNPAHLKTLIQQVHDQLLAQGMTNKDSEALVAPLHDLVNDPDFWHTPREGLAVFLSAAPDSLRTYSDSSPAIQFQDVAMVADHFHVKPLLPLLTGDGQFYILALSQHHVALYQASRDRIKPVEVPGLTHNLHEIVNEETSPNREHGRTSAQPAGIQPIGVSDSGDPGKDAKERVLHFCQDVDKLLHTTLADKSDLLVVAGLEYIDAIYREANTYPHLVAQSVAKDSATMPVDELHQAAWTVVEPVFRQAQDTAAEKYRQNSTTALIADKLADIVPAAYYARVECTVHCARL